MNTRPFQLRRALLALACAAALFALNAVTASAILWNPPCGATTVINNTPCTVGLCPAWAPMLVPPCTPFLNPFPGPGNVIVIPTPGPALQLNGMISWAGALLPLVPVPAAPPPPVPAPWWVPNFVTGPAPGCCVDVYVDPATCNIWVFPTRLPGPCRP